uniref:Uncharacterized protein n=1 Tax=Rhizophora mucronata TaxID=61149 RepID=A0A2P2IZ23_RHIMU
MPSSFLLPIIPCASSQQPDVFGVLQHVHCPYTCSHELFF